MEFTTSPRDTIYAGNSGLGGTGVAVLLGLVGGAVLGRIFNHGPLAGGLGHFPSCPTVSPCQPAMESSVTSSRLENAGGFSTILQNAADTARATTNQLLADAQAKAIVVEGKLDKLGEGLVAIAGFSKEIASITNANTQATICAIRDNTASVLADVNQKFACLNTQLTGSFSEENCKLNKIIELLGGLPTAISTNASMAHQASVIDSLKSQVASLLAAKA